MSNDSIKVKKKKDINKQSHTRQQTGLHKVTIYVACKRIPHMPLNSCAWNVDQWLYNAVFSSYTVYL